MDKGSPFLLKEREGHYTLAAGAAEWQCEWSKPAQPSWGHTGHLPTLPSPEGQFSSQFSSSLLHFSCLIWNGTGRFILPGEQVRPRQSSRELSAAQSWGICNLPWALCCSSCFSSSLQSRQLKWAWVCLQKLRSELWLEVHIFSLACA